MHMSNLHFTYLGTFMGVFLSAWKQTAHVNIIMGPMNDSFQTKWDSRLSQRLASRMFWKALPERTRHC